MGRKVGFLAMSIGATSLLFSIGALFFPITDTAVHSLALKAWEKNFMSIIVPLYRMRIYGVFISYESGWCGEQVNPDSNEERQAAAKVRADLCTPEFLGTLQDIRLKWCGVLGWFAPDVCYGFDMAWFMGIFYLGFVFVNAVLQVIALVMVWHYMNGNQYKKTRATAGTLVVCGLNLMAVTLTAYFFMVHLYLKGHGGLFSGNLSTVILSVAETTPMGWGYFLQWSALTLQSLEFYLIMAHLKSFKEDVFAVKREIRHDKRDFEEDYRAIAKEANKGAVNMAYQQGYGAVGYGYGVQDSYGAAGYVAYQEVPMGMAAGYPQAAMAPGPTSPW